MRYGKRRRTYRRVPNRCRGQRSGAPAIFATASATARLKSTATRGSRDAYHSIASSASATASGSHSTCGVAMPVVLVDPEPPAHLFPRDRLALPRPEAVDPTLDLRVPRG